MKELRRNMRLIGWLVVTLFLGLSGWFAWTAFTQGDIWASYWPPPARTAREGTWTTPSPAAPSPRPWVTPGA